MAFVAPTALDLQRRTLFSSRTAPVTRLPSRVPAPATAPSDVPHAVTSPAASLFGLGRGREFKTGKKRAADFRTAAQAAPHTVSDCAKFTAYVVSIDAVCQAGHHFQLTLNASGCAERHVAPGQFIQLGRTADPAPRRGPARTLAYLTLSSPPGGNADGNIEVLFGANADPLQLRSLKPGDHIDVSPVMGNGVDYARVTQTSGDLYVFADCVQGFAVAKSLVEWGTFRAMSGEGANRTNRIVIYYAIPSRKSLPFHERLSTWSVFAVNFVPLPGISIMEYMSEHSALGRARHSLALDHVLACVVSPDTFEALFCALVLQGFRRDAIHRHTEDSVAAEVRSFDAGSLFGWAENDAQSQARREAVESEMWQQWVGVREAMRRDFERKWAAQSRSYREASQSEAEKKQSWASWFVKNKDQWRQVEWDNDQWSNYWSSWKSPAAGGGSGGSAYDSGTGAGSSSTDYKWSQQNSQEYWDWVKKGTGSSKSSSSSGESYGAWDQDFYGGSQGWNAGSQSGYQKGGYKYTHQEPDDQNSKSDGYSGGSYGSSQGGQRSNTWGQWTNRNNGQRQAYSSSGQRSGGYSGSKGGDVFGDIDFYSILGITSGASRSDIKKAYRKKAMEHHPDRNLGKSEEAHIKMKQIVVAWSVLKDDSKRQKYDKYGPTGL